MDRKGKLCLHKVALFSCKNAGQALFQKKSLNLHMPGRVRPYLRRIPFGVPADFNLWEEEEAQPLHLLRSNLIMDCRFRRSRAVLTFATFLPNAKGRAEGTTKIAHMQIILQENDNW